MAGTLTESMQARLRALGLTEAARQMAQDEALARKLDVAYTHYRYVTPEQITKLQKELERTTREKTPMGYYRYHTLTFTALAQYPKIPPAAVLDALETAITHRCFDSFEVASIQWHVEVPDPLLFGCITGCDDKFFLAQWDEDVKIEELLQADEGYVKPGHEG